MKKSIPIITNVVLLCWFFLDMVGVYVGDKYLVTRSYKEDGIFMIIPTLALLLFIFREKIGKYVLIVWLSLWSVMQFLSHEWYTIFGRGIMGNVESKIRYFKDAIRLIESDTRYITDVYHTILHIFLIIALITTIAYSISKREKVAK